MVVGLSLVKKRGEFVAVGVGVVYAGLVAFVNSLCAVSFAV